MTSRPSALAVLAALAFAWSGRCQDAPPRTYTVGGVVVNPGGAPAKRVRVSIAPVENPAREIGITTGEDGRFRFADLRAGKYALRADTPAGVRQAFLGTSGTGFGVAIVAGDGQRTEDLIFRLVPRAAIHGKIVDQGGDPVEQASVQLFRSSILAGRRRVHLYSYAYSDDRGEYRFAGLPPGTWYLLASGRPWYTERLETQPASPLARMGYPSTFYPGTRDPRGAAPLRLQAGQDLAADLTLVAMPGGNLEIVISGESSEPAYVQVTFEGVAGARSFERSETIQSEAQLGGLPPGRYKVQATATDAGRWSFAEETVQVGAGDSKLELNLTKAPAISGVVTFDGLSAVPPGTVIILRDEETGTTGGLEVSGDGQFHIEAIPRGSYHLAIADASSMRPFGIRRLLIDGAPAKSQLLEISKSARLDVSATRGGSVSGYAFRKDAPVAGALVVLAPRTDSTNPFDYEAFQTDSDGSFEFHNVAPGDYVAFAVEDLDDFEYANPEAVRPRMKSGQPVRVENGQDQKIRLELE
ncbi:MAG TPA: carboxypeptidase regulatory-like domain-containing protein [Bryobacteraceae bacterium]|nr:carboxypeptidase regulatory-like domain-containing protein [Bryobacteraceae bacterium]